MIDLIAIIIFISISLTLIFKCKNSLHLDKEIKVFFFLSFPYRIMLGLASFALYKHHYANPNLDTLYFLHGTKMVTKVLNNSFSDFIDLILYNEVSKYKYFSFLFTDDVRSSFFIKLISPIAMISFENGWILSAYLSLFSLIASWDLYKTLSDNFPKIKWPYLISFIFWPSVAFWSSGIVKETVALALMFFIISSLIKIKYNSITFSRIIVTILFSYFLLKFKYYYFTSLFIPSCFFILSHFLKYKNNKTTIFYSTCLLLLIILSLNIIHPVFNFNIFPEIVFNGYQNSISISDSNSIFYYDLKPTWSSLFTNIPISIINGILRPFIWEVNSPIQMILALENAIIFSIQILFLFACKKNFQWKKDVVYIIIYVLILGSILPIASPNFGTIARYRISYLPFILLLQFSIIFPSLNKISRFVIFKK